jgi:hypothetical protein
MSLKFDDDVRNAEFLLWLPVDFPYGDLHLLSARLAEADICVPGYIPPEVGLYHPSGYLYENKFEGIQTVLIPDRNIASRFAKLALSDVSVCETNRGT